MGRACGYYLRLKLALFAGCEECQSVQAMSVVRSHRRVELIALGLRVTGHRVGVGRHEIRIRGSDAVARGGADGQRRIHQRGASCWGLRGLDWGRLRPGSRWFHLLARVVGVLGACAAGVAAVLVGAPVLFHIVLARKSLFAVRADGVLLARVLLRVSCSVARGGEIVVAGELLGQRARVLVLLGLGVGRRHGLALNSGRSHKDVLAVRVGRRDEGHLALGRAVVCCHLLREGKVGQRPRLMARRVAGVIVGISWRDGRRRVGHGGRVCRVRTQELRRLGRETGRRSVTRGARAKGGGLKRGQAGVGERRVVRVREGVRV